MRPSDFRPYRRDENLGENVKEKVQEGNFA